MPSFLEKYTPDLAAYEDLYRHFHANPELTFFEKETAAKCASHLRSLTSDFIIRTDIGGHGLIAILKNGEGKIVLLRADMDALPIREATGLEYASQKTMKDHEGIEKPVMHGLCL
jgi:metal-dependent amidase/aminoacylase/carboxypeptidase family protein